MINLDDRLLDQLTADQMWLLLHIVKRINADMECWPSTRTLMRDTKWSDIKKVRRVRDELVDAGIIEAYERTRDDGGQASNIYRIKTEQVGVFVTAKKLQNLTRGEGKNLTRGVGKEDTRGEGKDITRANEVLTNEVLTSENKHTPREEKISTDWKQVARTMADHARGEGKEDWQYMTAMYNYTGRPEEVMSEWACKATPYQLQTWRDHFPRLLPWVKRAAQSKARQSFRGAPEDAPAPTYTKTKPRPRPEWTPADIEQFRKTFEG